MRRIFAIIALLFLAGCSVTRHVPPGSYMLTDNRVVPDKSVPKKERIRPDRVETYIQQTPAKRLLGTNLGLWIYAASSPDTANHSWINRTLRGIGTAPVLLDTTLVRRSSAYITTYIHSGGYFNGTTSASIDTSKPKKARVTYALAQGEPYRIRSIRTTFRDRFVEPMVLQDSAGTLLRTGIPFDTELLDKERRRIKDYLQNRGYYNFNVSNIRYNAHLGDTAAGERHVDLEMLVEQNLTEYTDEGLPVLSNNSVYRLGRINLYPDYDPMRALSDSAWIASLDTIWYNGLNIIYSDRLRVREEVLRQNISLQENYLFSATDVSRAYSNLMSLGYYKSARIAFSDMEQPGGQNFVTFIGPDGSVVTGEQTAERYLECHIYCTPSLRQGYNVGLETTFTSDYYGISATGGYRNRNLLRGIEMFDLSITGSYDWMRVKGKKTSFELGTTASITFPRFIAPRLRVMRSAVTPRTMLSLSINAQRRPYYQRVLSNVTWGYNWSDGRHTTFSVRPVDLSLVKMNNIDSTFFNDLVNPYLRESYQDQLLAGISGSWVYNNLATRRGNSFTVRFNWETTGNLFGGVSALLGKKKSGEDFYRIAGLQFAQYVRGDLAISSGIPLGQFTLAWRLYGGAAYTYGNSRVMPYDRLFWAGGANSMRGWAARTLGPGIEPRPEAAIYPMQLGNMRLEANLEGRFPIWSIVGGAVFFDLGNVWYTGQAQEDSPESIFRLKRFYRQLGFNTGVGLRVDISMAVLRVDWGIRLHDPNEAAGRRWIHNARMRNTAVSFTVGYPF